MPRLAANLPDELVIAPGIYRVWGKSYDATDEGLYRFVNPGRGNRQRIVYKKDIDALLSGIAWIACHGTADDGLTRRELRKKALTGKLSLTCGPLCKFAHSLLDRAGAKSRIVSCLTLDEWNSYDNGHTLIEVFRKKWGKYIVYDLDNNAYFLRPGDETPLSLLELAMAVSAKNYPVVVALANDTRLDIGSFRSAGGFDQAFLGERIQADLGAWYQRVMQVPLIKDGTHYYFFNKADKERIISYNSRFRYMDAEGFLKKFYPNQPAGAR